PPAVERVLLKALAKNPSERYPTATALMLDLQKALQVAGVDELDASRIARANALGDEIPMNTPGGGEYARVSIINGRKAVMIPVIPSDMRIEQPNLSWQEWLQLFIERLSDRRYSGAIG
ncbi:MAG TPA: hypothetical protein PLZ51_15855, partial [Aggregatilineales bacterium]|nr:hypothetical protein [Aggregatilineales bacterium]